MDQDTLEKVTTLSETTIQINKTTFTTKRMNIAKALKGQEL